jgi:hypothetical protein
MGGYAVLLTSIRADGHADTPVKEPAKPLVREAFNPLVNEIEIHLDALPARSFREPSDRLDTRMGRGCG